jgi:hypothetical protein
MPDDTDAIERTLDELQLESEQRRQELREIAAQLPAAVGRRAMLRAMAVDFRHAPGKADLVLRAVRKLARAPRGAYRRARHRLRQRRR